MPKADSFQGSLDCTGMPSCRQSRTRPATCYGPGRARSILRSTGWIWAEGMTKENGRRARLYELTPAGRKQVGAEESRWQAVTAAVNRVLRTV